MYNKNKKYETPSGLGGVFTLMYVKKQDDKYHFCILNPGFEDILKFTEAESKFAITEAD